MDYQGLLAAHAPKDEFEPEIKRLCNMIKIYNSVEEIADLLALVFNESFSENDISDMFLKCASNIREMLDDLMETKD